MAYKITVVHSEGNKKEVFTCERYRYDNGNLVLTFKDNTELVLERSVIKGARIGMPDEGSNERFQINS